MPPYTRLGRETITFTSEQHYKLTYEIRYWFLLEKLGKAEWKDSNQPSRRRGKRFNPRGVYELNERLVSEETVIPRRCGSETIKFAIKYVGKGQIFTVKR